MGSIPIPPAWGFDVSYQVPYMGGEFIVNNKLNLDNEELKLQIN